MRLIYLSVDNSDNKYSKSSKQIQLELIVKDLRKDNFFKLDDHRIYEIHNSYYNLLVNNSLLLMKPLEDIN